MTAAIPTTYAGCRFRSRLEARWAAFFDLVGWRWEYEPVDLRGYIPDFVLPFEAGPVLWEVKPAFEVADLSPAARKIDRSGWESRNVNDAVAVGAAALMPAEGWLPSGGVMRQQVQEEHQSAGKGLWAIAMWHYCPACKRLSMHHEEQWWCCLACGASDGDGLLDPPARHGIHLDEVWNVAGAKVQWAP